MFAIPGIEDDDAVRLKGEMVRSDSRGIGVKFEKLKKNLKGRSRPRSKIDKETIYSRIGYKKSRDRRRVGKRPQNPQ